jgi:hypothetical protein
MNHIFNIIKKFFKDDQKKTLLGRWGIQYCPDILTKKIYLANEDNCGPCGQYQPKLAIVKKEKKNK